MLLLSARKLCLNESTIIVKLLPLQIRFVNDIIGLDDIKHAQKVTNLINTFHKSALNVKLNHSGQSDQNCCLLLCVSPNSHIHRNDIISSTRMLLHLSLTIEFLQWLILAKILVSEGKNPHYSSPAVAIFDLHRKLKLC